MESYIIHDNGGEPFEVKVDNGAVIVYHHEEGDTEIWRHASPQHIFLGEDPYSEKKDKDIGNSVLVKIDKNNYVFIGKEIFSFKTTDEIKTFVSPIGNSDVPYPYAIGTKFVYLLIENVFFPVKRFEPYGLHYGHKPQTTKLTKQMIQSRID
jgi:hypothetical protein